MLKLQGCVLILRGSQSTCVQATAGGVGGGWGRGRDCQENLQGRVQGCSFTEERRTSCALGPGVDRKSEGGCPSRTERGYLGLLE